jgi:hypothetical protein
MKTMGIYSLDNEFFNHLGRYVANCAYIEREAWLLIAELKGYTILNDLEKILEMKKSYGPSKLVAELRDASKNSAIQYQLQIQEICEYTEKFIDNRHMAIHGTWTKASDGYKVEYFKNLGTKKFPNWGRFDDTITKEYICNAVNDALRLASRLREIRNGISIHPSSTR